MYVDANILITIYRERNSEQTERIISYLDSPNRQIITSDFLLLETVPKPTFYKRQGEAAFIKNFVARAYQCVSASPKIVHEAISYASRYDLHSLDALHISAAIFAKADEFLTLERPNSPLCRVKEVSVISLYRQATGT